MYIFKIQKLKYIWSIVQWVKYNFSNSLHVILYMCVWKLRTTLYTRFGFLNLAHQVWSLVYKLIRDSIICFSSFNWWLMVTIIWVLSCVSYDLRKTDCVKNKEFDFERVWGISAIWPPKMCGFPFQSYRR